MTLLVILVGTLMGVLVLGFLALLGWAIISPRRAWMTFLTALGGVVRHRLRAFLSTIGVAIGVATLMAIYSLTQGLTQSFATQLATMGAHTLYVSKAPWMHRGDWWMFRNRPNITLDEMRTIRDEADLLTAVSPMTFNMAEVGYSGENLSLVSIRGVNADYVDTANVKLADGRFLSPIEGDQDRPVVVIGADIREKLFHNSDPIGARITVGKRMYTVIGVLAAMGTSFGTSMDYQVLIPVESFQRQFGNRRGILIAAATTPENVSAAEDQIIEVLRRKRGLTAEQQDNFAINRQSEMVKMFDDQMSSLYLVGIIVGIVTLIVGAIGVMNIMLVAVTERTREIGVRRALGARKTTVLVQFLLEASFVTMLGGIVGTGSGLFGAWVLTQVAPIEAVTSPESALIGVLVAGVVGLIAGSWPAWRAANLDPIESLRYE
jgi:putative ABC transport system permease protein